MSVKIMGLVWDLDNSVIDREEKYVLLAYVDHADHNGCSIFPSIALICQKTGYKERAAQMITRSLVEKGFLIPDGKGPKGTNKWRYGGGAKNAGVQKEIKRGAKRKGKGGAEANAPEPSEAPSLEPSVKKAAPPQPPEILLFKEVVKHYPKQAQREMVIDAVKKVNARLRRDVTLEDLQPFFKEWCKVSANDWSLVWLVDWAVPGTINGKVNHAINSKPADTQPSSEALARAERINELRRAGHIV
jgi:hypothetical protein